MQEECPERGVLAKMAEDERPRVRFYYERNPDGHTIHVTGVYGGVTPDYNIYMALFSEYPPIPERADQPMNQDGVLGAEIPETRQVKDGYVRHIEFDGILSAETAMGLRSWLDIQIESILESRRRSTRSEN